MRRRVIGAPGVSIRTRGVTAPACAFSIGDAVRAFPFLLLALFAPLQLRAQEGPAGRIGAAVGEVIELVTETAHLAAVAFVGEPLALPQANRVATPVSAGVRTRRALVAVCAMSGVGFLMGLIVLVTAQGPLENVAKTAERDVSRSFWVGLLWQVLAVPLLITLALALALTILLIPAIPIAALAWALAYAGAISLGLFAIALVLGRAMLGRSTTGNRNALLSSLVLGLFVLSAVWVAAALCVSIPIVGILVRVLALAVTWGAATVGLGAVVRSRAGAAMLSMETTTEAAVPSWQTPTPVFGVVAARRPTPVSSTTAE